MSTRNYKFEWIGSVQWRLTSRRGMVWEGELDSDSVDAKRVQSKHLVLLHTNITKGVNSPIPVNGIEKIRYYINRSIINGIEQIANCLLYK